MGRFKGIIALDIDGTITVSRDALEQKIADYFNTLIEKQWLLIFLTGRTFSFAKPILSGIKGNFYLGVQNGAALYQMPDLKCLRKNYVPAHQIKEVQPIVKSMGVGLLIEAGRENEDHCYYIPKEFSSKEMEYLFFRMEISSEKWFAVDSFASLPITEFAVGKFFASEMIAMKIAEEIFKQFPLSVTVIRDPFRPGFHLAHINSKYASKGQILQGFADQLGEKLPIIGAGDDYNDIEMLEKSTIKIVMENGPEKIHALADIIAPPAKMGGIVQGVEEAIRLLNGS